MTPTTHSQTIDLIDSLPGAVALIDLHGTVVHCSKGCDHLIEKQERDWFAEAIATIVRPESGHLDTYLVTPSKRELSISWGSALPCGHILLLDELTTTSTQTRTTFLPSSSVSANDPTHDLSSVAQLPDQTKFIDRLVNDVQGLDDSQHHLFLMNIGLTGLRSINDTLGYRMVDQLLDLFLSRLMDSGLPFNTVGRLTSGEFLVVVQLEFGQTDTAAEVDSATGLIANNILDLATRSYIINEELLSIGCTIGVAQLQPNPESARLSDRKNAQTRCDELLRQAVIARHGVLQHSQTGFLHFSDSMDRQIRERRRLENDLRKAIALQEFELYFQPKINLASMKIIGFEALIRWQHPTRGMVSPFEFIPVAETLGLIVPIGKWVIQEACKCAAYWPKDQSIAINLSPVQFAHPELQHDIEQAIANSGVRASQVELEITESVILDNESIGRTEDIVTTLEALKQRGICIAMDDFGTGYSSMSYLAKFPFDTLKIDQSFVRDPSNEADNAKIRTAITTLGKQFGLAIVAEGIETKDQLSLLTAEQCDIGQGYLFSRPVPFRETFELLNHFNHLNLAGPVSSSKPLVSSEEDQDASDNDTAQDKASGDELLRLVYISTNLLKDTGEDLQAIISDIMTASINNNAAAEITGALMFNDSVFAQVLEGPPARVEETFERIQRDSRHSDVIVLDCRKSATRTFPNWAMAFIGECETNGTAFHEIAALTDFSDKPLQGEKILQTLLGLVYEKAGPDQQVA